MLNPPAQEIFSKTIRCNIASKIMGLLVLAVEKPTERNLKMKRKGEN